MMITARSDRWGPCWHAWQQGWRVSEGGRGLAPQWHRRAYVMTKSMMVAALVLSWLYLYGHRRMVVNANVEMHNLSYRSSLAPSLSSHSCLWMSPS